MAYDYNFINDLLATNTTLKSRSEKEFFLTLSEGNKKLKNNSRVRFLVWNIPAVITCPYRTAHCEGSCYALKAEKQYPDALPARMAHLEATKKADFVLRMIFTIKSHLDRPIMKNKKVVFRIHESGDFYNKTYANKWLDVMRYFEDDKRIVFVAYTKSVIYFDGINLPDNFYLLASVWDDTTPENMEIIKKNNFRIYTAFDGKLLEEALSSGLYTRCSCEDCAGCGLCWNNYTKNICVEIH